MSQKASYFKIGLFVLIATALLLIGAVMLGAGQFLKQEVVIETYFSDSVNGLDEGTPVKYRGVTIGQVKRIAFAGEVYPQAHLNVPGSDAGYVLVELAMEPSRRPQVEHAAVAVAKGLRVRPAQAGLVGGVYLEMVFVDPKLYPPLEINWSPNHPYVPSIRSRNEQIATAAERLATELQKADVGKLIGNLTVLSHRLDDTLIKMNPDALAADIRSAVAEARGAAAKANELLGEGPLRTALSDLPEITARGKDLANRLDALVSDQSIADLPETLARARSAATTIDQMLADPKVKDMLANVGQGAATAQDAAADLRRVTDRLDRLLSSQEDDIRQIVAGLRRVLTNAGDLVIDARQNPSRLLLGNPPPHVNPTETGGR